MANLKKYSVTGGVRDYTYIFFLFIIRGYYYFFLKDNSTIKLLVLLETGKKTLSQT